MVDSNDTETRGQNPPLIVDPSSDFLKTLRDGISLGITQFLTTSSGKEAQKQLADMNIKLSALFVNSRIGDVPASSVIRYAHHFRIVLPVFVLHDGNEPPPFSNKEMKNLGIQKCIAKPISSEQIMNLIRPEALKFDALSTMGASKFSSDNLNKELDFDDSNFIGVSITTFPMGSTSFFDVYVRLGTGKYVKILNAGESLSLERIQSYLKKGLSSFHIRKEMHEKLLAYCDTVATAAIKSSRVNVEAKVNQALLHGQVLIEHFKETGIDNENIRYASQFIDNVKKTVKELKLDERSEIRNLIADVMSFDHAAATSMVGALIFRPFDIASDNPVESIGLACLLHDVGLKYLNPPIDVEDESELSEAQLAVFQQHPEVGSKLVSSIRRVKPIVVQAILQHHERRNHKGFPHHIGPGSLSLVSEIVGIADEYIRFFRKIKKGILFNHQFYLEHRIYNAFSPKLVVEFKRIFKVDQSLVQDLAKSEDNKLEQPIASESKDPSKK